MNPKAVAELLRQTSPVTTYGKVSKVVGLVAEGGGLKAPLGALCHILPEGAREGGQQGIPVEVVGFRDGKLLFMPYGDLRGIQPGSLIRNSSLPPVFPVSDDMLGKAFDAFGAHMGQDAMARSTGTMPLYADPPPPFFPDRASRTTWMSVCGPSTAC